MFCLIAAGGGGTKLLQSYLDNHPEIYNIPAYPMLYFYPHWFVWEKEMADSWNLDSIIDIFCDKHASVIDSRKIIGLNGLDSLGDNYNEFIQIDEKEFRWNLKEILSNEPIERIINAAETT